MQFCTNDDDDDKGDKDIPWEWSARCRQRFCEAVHFWGNMARELRWLGFSRCKGLSLQTQVLDAPPRPARGIQKWIEFYWSNIKPFQTQKYKRWHKRCARWRNLANKDNLYHSLLITHPFANLNGSEFKDSHSRISHGYINRININLITFAPSDKTSLKNMIVGHVDSFR